MCSTGSFLNTFKRYSFWHNWRVSQVWPRGLSYSSPFLFFQPAVWPIFTSTWFHNAYCISSKSMSMVSKTSLIVKPISSFFFLISSSWPNLDNFHLSWRVHFVFWLFARCPTWHLLRVSQDPFSIRRHVLGLFDRDLPSFDLSSSAPSDPFSSMSSASSAPESVTTSFDASPCGLSATCASSWSRPSLIEA